MNTTKQNQIDFNTVWQWFIVEKKPRSMGEYKDCLYSGPGGDRCAYGVCLTDEELAYTIEAGMNGMSCGLVIDRLGITRHDDTDYFYSNLQRTHDTPNMNKEYFVTDVSKPKSPSHYDFKGDFTGLIEKRLRMLTNILPCLFLHFLKLVKSFFTSRMETISERSFPQRPW